MNPNKAKALCWLTIVASLLGLVVLSIGRADDELGYDESIYLNIARAISDTGLPLRTMSTSIWHKTVFTTSPPLVTYVASVSVAQTRTDALLARIVHACVFVFPLFIAVTWMSARQYGLTAGAVSAVAFCFSGYFLEGAYRVRLDVPLGLFSLFALWFYAKSIAESANGRRRSVLFALFIACVFAVWTKYQAVVAIASIGFICALGVLTKGEGARWRHLTSLATVLAASIVAIAALAALYVYADPDVVASQFSRNLSRFSPSNTSLFDSAYSILSVIRGSISNVGGPLVAVAAISFVTGPRPSPFTELLGVFCVATVAFNILSYALPGGGSTYLLPMVPALCVLAGCSARSLLSPRWSPMGPRLLVVLGLLQMAVGFPRPALRFDPKPSDHALVGAFIQRNSEPEQGILAFDCTPEFYSDRPVGLLQYMEPEVILAALRGEGSCEVEFLVTRQDVSVGPSIDPRGTLESVWSDVQSELRSRFTKDNVAGSLIVYRRRRDCAQR